MYDPKSLSEDVGGVAGGGLLAEKFEGQPFQNQGKTLVWDFAEFQSSQIEELEFSATLTKSDGSEIPLDFSVPIDSKEPNPFKNCDDEQLQYIRDFYLG